MVKMVRRTKLGMGFGESLISEKRRPREVLGKQDLGESGRGGREMLLAGIFLGGLVLLLGRAFWLTVVRGATYRTMSDQNRIREEVIRAPRGMILDRNGIPLTANVPVFRVEERDKNGELTGYKVIGRDEALTRDAEGLPLLTDPGRSYPLGQVSAQLVGYVSEVSQDELKNPGGDCPKNPLLLGDFVGRGGLEQQYDCLLRGKNGRRIYETDTTGKVVRVLGEEQPESGQDLRTSIDARLEQVAYSALGGKDGAVVAMEASTGAILAMVSSPSFDPNVFSLPSDNGLQAAAILNDPASPLLNRALGGAYPAGSVFKMTVASAALSEGKITPSFTIDDPGIISAGGLSFSNWYYSQYGRKEGIVDVVKALARSTDTFFYEIGALTGPDLMAEWAEKFGLGRKTGVDVPGEVSGLIPTPVWKMKTKGEDWYLGNTYNMSIGQGDVLVTPLQVAQMTQVVADGGVICVPHVYGKASCKPIGIKSGVLDEVIKGMVGACSTGGTAFPLFDFKPQVACKTGTAQYGIEGKLTHAWLTAFAPVEKPEIVVTALVEGGGEGSAVAAPIAKAVLSEWFKDYKD